MSTIPPPERAQTNENENAPMMSNQENIMKRAEENAGLYHSIIVTQNGSYVEQRGGEEKREETVSTEGVRVDIEEIYKRLIDCDSPDHTKDFAIIMQAKERLKDPETVKMLEGWKEHLGIEKIVVVDENEKARFVDVSKNLNVPKQVDRYKVLMEGDNGAKMIDEYIQYELEEADTLRDEEKLSDTEKPEFIQWIKVLLNSPGSAMSGPDSVEARFIAFAHRAKLISHASYDTIAKDNPGIYENITVTWYEKSLVEVFRAKIAPRGRRGLGYAYHVEDDADFRRDRLGARLVG